jgi:uncharacterized membrane protein YhdT
MDNSTIVMIVIGVVAFLSMSGGSNSHGKGKHSHQNHGVKLFTSKDLHQINQYRANRAMQDHSASQGAAFFAFFALIGAGLCAFCLPENFIGYKNFNGWCALICLGLAFVFVIISRLSGVHIDPTNRYADDNEDEY